MESIQTPQAIPPQSNKWKIFIIPIILIIVFLAIGNLYLFYFSGDDFLQDYDEVIDYETLVDEVNFSHELTQDYTRNPISVVDLDISREGNLFVTDSSGHRIMVFDSDLNNIRNIGEKYSEDSGSIISGRVTNVEEMMQFPGSSALAGNYIYAIDRMNRRINTYTLNGDFVEWRNFPEEVISQTDVGEAPHIDGQRVSLIVLNNGDLLLHSLTSNNVYILDFETLAIKKTLTFEGMKAFGVGKSLKGFYVIDSLNKKVYEYSEDLSLIGTIDSELINPVDVCVLSDKFVITDEGDDSLKLFNLDFSFIEKKELTGISPDFIACEEDVVYIFDDSEGRVVKISLDNLEVKKEVSVISQLNILKGAPIFIASSQMNGDVAIEDSQNNLILILDEDLNYKNIIGIGFGDSPNKFKFPTGLSYDNDGNLYVLDRWNTKIKIYDSDYNYIRSIDDIGYSGNDMIVLDNGNIMYLDVDTYTVKFIDSDGNLVGELTEEKGMIAPHGLGIYKSNYIVSDEVPRESDGHYDVYFKEYDKNYNFVKSHVMPNPTVFETSETLSIYGDMVIMPDNDENNLFFYDLINDEIIENITVSHASFFGAIEVELPAGKDYVLVTNQMDGKLFKIDINSRKIVDEKRISLYYKEY